MHCRVTQRDCFTSIPIFCKCKAWRWTQRALFGKAMERPQLDQLVPKCWPHTFHYLAWQEKLPGVLQACLLTPQIQRSTSSPYSWDWDSSDSWLLRWFNWERPRHAKVQPTKGFQLPKLLLSFFSAAILVAWWTFSEAFTVKVGQNTIFWITVMMRRIKCWWKGAYL